MTTYLAQKPVSGEIESLPGYGKPIHIGNANNNLTSIISDIITFITVLAGIAFVLFFILGALKWVTAGQDTAKVDGAKAQMTNAAIGIIAVIAAYGIAAIISTVLGLDILSPGSIITNLGP